MNDPRINITYDFEGDDDDIEEYERSLRRLHPVEEYPYFGTGEEYDDDDHTARKNCKCRVCKTGRE